MSDKSRIEWTEATWNPVTGCSKVSQGCVNCYALRDWARMSANPNTVYHGRKFTDVQCHPERLDQPLRWTKPRRVFVNSMSDLFHESVPDDFIDRVFAVMALCPRHTFQVLTKRPERMHEYLTALIPDKAGHRWYEAIKGMFRYKDTTGQLGPEDTIPSRQSPVLPNVWLGVSIEDQATADERIPLLLQTPAAVRWVSAEPLLGPIKLDGHEYIHWLVVGGESGPNARPMQIEWARSLRDQCVVAGVPYFFKQWGEFHPTTEYRDGKVFMNRIGKKAAGRLLDGRTWDQYPGGSNASAV